MSGGLEWKPSPRRRRRDDETAIGARGTYRAYRVRCAAGFLCYAATIDGALIRFSMSPAGAKALAAQHDAGEINCAPAQPDADRVA